MRFRFTSLALVLLLGCEKSPLDHEADEFDDARARWQQHGVSSYSYNLQLHCFCKLDAVRPVTITVINDVTTGIVFTDSAGGSAPADLFDDMLTVDQLFDLIEWMIARRPARMTVRYDPARGFPVSVVVDQDVRMADDEITIAISGFEPDL